MDKFSILIIDDKEENIYALRLIIEDSFDNVDILEASSVDQALVLIMKNDINLILSDVQMPNISGFDLVSYLKDIEQTKDIPIILISAIYNDSKYIKEGYDLGAVDYISKPIDDEILCSKLKVYIDIYKKVSNQSEEISEKNRLLIEQIKINSMIDSLEEKDIKIKEYDGFLYEEDSEIDFKQVMKVKKKIDDMMQ